MDWSRFWEIPKRKVFFLGLAILLVIVIIMAGIVVREKYPAIWARFWGRNASTTAAGDVLVPTIVGGQLVLPKVAGLTGGGGLAQTTLPGRLGVISANLIGIFDPSASSGQASKLGAIRILGETNNLSANYVSGITSVIRFLDADGKTVGQKVGELTNGFVWHDLASGDKTFYDVTVADPPTSDKLEIILNATSSSSSATFETLKIMNRNIEVKTATYQGNQQPTTNNQQTGTASAESTPSAEATASASVPLADQIQYFTVTGSVYNALGDPVTDIAVYTWVKDATGKVFGFGSQEFKNDLVMPGGKMGFHINILPLRTDEKYDNYEIQAWGRRYRLNM